MIKNTQNARNNKVKDKTNKTLKKNKYYEL